MNDDLKARIPAQIPLSPDEEKLIRRYCLKTGAAFGRLCAIALLDYIKRQGNGK